ncbi:DUF2804 domain-containing protein [Spongiibacter sp. KMU-166]|uniref:DUF2804 domain-containing protein n=1 Tax=Spongiibacter thalassae TaxID=2721624 RepID=A0ABX1GHV1_9GAMM|nr:DUF2804 domain-containing protein [Spongiibacter thalassae]
MQMDEKLVDAQGRVALGRFDAPCKEVNYLDYALRTAMDRPRSKLARRFAVNQFQFVAISSPQLLVGLAIVDLKWVSNAFVYCYSPETGDFEEASFIVPLGRHTRFDNRPNDGVSAFRSGRNRFTITARPGEREVSVVLKSGLQVDAHIDEASHYQPVAVATRAGYQGWAYTQKAAARPVTGRVSWRHRQYDLGELEALGSVDWTTGFMRRETFWNWASLSARLPDGRTLGLNFAAGVNDTGVTENALWLDGRRVDLATVNFEFDRQNPDGEWQINDFNDDVQLRFVPIGARREKVNAGLLASNFTQHFGRLYGKLRIDNKAIEINGLLGLVEDHYAKW